MKRPLHPFFRLPISADDSLDLRRNLAIIVCALNAQPDGQIPSKKALLDQCVIICQRTHTDQCRGNLANSACQSVLRSPFVVIAKAGRRKSYTLTHIGQQLITFARDFPVRYLSNLLATLAM